MLHASDFEAVARKLGWPLKSDEMDALVNCLGDGSLVNYTKLLDAVDSWVEEQQAKEEPAQAPALSASRDLGRSKSPGRASRLQSSGH